MPPEEIVTLKDIYMSVQDSNNRLAAVEGKVDHALDSRNDHEDRIRSIERMLYALPPTFLLAVAGVIAAFIKGGK